MQSLLKAKYTIKEKLKLNAHLYKKKCSSSLIHIYAKYWWYPYLQ